MSMSRNEDILQAIVDGTSVSELPPPKSREERLLHEVLNKLNNGGGSGGGGLSIYICSSSEYNAITGVPIIDDPSPTTFYLVPTGDGANDIYEEWVYVDEKWERFGSGMHIVGSLEALSDVRISDLEDGHALVYNAESGKWENSYYSSGETYTFSEGNVNGAFLVEDGSGNSQTVSVHGLLPFCFSDNEEVIIFDSGSIDD